MKATPAPMGPPQAIGLQGTVKSWNGSKGYGFINCDQTAGDVFFSRNELPEEAREVRGNFLEGRTVSFDSHQTDDGRLKASNVQILVVEGQPMAGIIKSYSEQNRYGFISCTSLADDVRFQASDLPMVMPGAHLKGKLVTFDMQQMPDGKLRVTKMQFQTSKIAAEVNALGGGKGAPGGFQRLALPAMPAPAAQPLQQHHMQQHHMQQQQHNGGGMGMLTGMVKSFSDRNGYGFISAPGQAQDLKFGKADLIGETVAAGTMVSFMPAMSPDGRMQARQVQPAGQKRPGGNFGGAAGNGAALPRPNKQPRTGPWENPSSAGPWQSPSASFAGAGAGQSMTGMVKSYIPTKGFGFITTPQVAGDVYFMRQALPAEVQDSELKGMSVSFELTFTADGKQRAQNVVLGGAAAPMEQASTGIPAVDMLLQGQIMSGTVKSFIPTKGFGFITTPQVAGDVYFMRQSLPPEAQNSELKGMQVSFELAFTADGKQRAQNVALL